MGAFLKLLRFLVALCFEENMSSLSENGAQFALNRALEAFECLASGHMENAARIWLSAIQQRDHSSPFDVFEFANAGIGALMLGRKRSVALTLLDRADGELSKLTEAAAREELSIGATSSAHHFHLASKHYRSFSAAGKRRSRLLLSTMSSVLRFHRKVASGSLDLDDRIDDLRETLAKCFGRSAPEIALLCTSEDVTIESCYSAKAERLRTLLTTTVPRKPVDCEVIASALGLLAPSMIAATRSADDLLGEDL